MYMDWSDSYALHQVVVVRCSTMSKQTDVAWTASGQYFLSCLRKWTQQCFIFDHENLDHFNLLNEEEPGEELNIMFDNCSGQNKKTDSKLS